MSVQNALEPTELRRVFGAFPTGVTAIAALVGGLPVGLAANSFTTVSLDPPVVSVCVAHSSRTWPQLRTVRRCGVSVLGAHQERACRQLGARSGDRVAGLGWRASAAGAVLLDGASAWLECGIDRQIPAGDHDIMLLRVHELDADWDVAPLVFHGSRVPPVGILTNGWFDALSRHLPVAVAAWWEDTDVDISAKTDYAVRALLELASREPALVKVDVIIAEQAMPRKFIEAILGELRRAGIVRSQRGAEGGYGLARPPGKITIGAVMRAVDGPLAEVHGLRPHETLYGGAAEHLPDLWVAVRASLRRVLDETTLLQVLNGNLPAHVRRLVGQKDAWLPR